MIESNILVRHRVEDERTKTTKYYIFLVPLSLDTIQYFDYVARLAWMLLQFLVDNTLISLANEEKDFVPRNLFFEKESNRERICQITEKIKSYIMPNFEGVLIVNPPLKDEDKKRIEETIKRDHIFKMAKDILNIENLQKTFRLEKKG